jgi:site-specific recombinase XerD
VDRSGEVWEYRPASHKTQHHGRERIIYIGPQAQAVLLPYLLRDTQANCFSPADSEQKRHIEQRKRRRTRVQPSQQNRRKAKPARLPRTAYTKDSYQRSIARAIVKGNKDRTKAAADMGVEPVLLPHWHANQLRHSKATEIRRQFGLEAAQVILGHAKADVTQVYAERDARLAAEVARQVG